MKKYFFLLILIMIYITGITFELSAQIKTDDNQASITLNNGETLTGWIKNETLSKMNVGVKFRSSANKEFTTYTIQEFKSLQLNNGETYKVLAVSTLTDSVKTNILGALILKGELSIYRANYNEEDIYIAFKNEKTFCLQNDELISYDRNITRHYFKQILFSAVQNGGISEEEVNQINFSEEDIIRIAIKYNTNKNAKSEKFEFKTPNEKFVIANVSGNFLDKDDIEGLANVFYRIYNPRISKSTSVNIGLQYSFRKKTEPADLNGTNKVKPTYTSITLPILIQQNILIKKIRPFFKGGLGLSYIKVTGKDQIPDRDIGFQKNYGLIILYGVGLEVDISKNLMLKSDFYKDALDHLITAGIAYNLHLN